ncbi:MAG: SWIM zinc finger family protein [Desulfobacteraceae bacterium]|nr:SWIM zinc finger family protein [Desulfobacteraceae bacterium]
MQFNYKYNGSSSVTSNPRAVGMSFAPDTYREPTFFVGKLRKHIPFREAVSALHDVVVSDLRFTPKDKTEYKEWAAKQEEIWLAEMMAGLVDVKDRIKVIQNRLNTVRNEKQRIMDPFNKAKKTYFNYLYKRDYEAWMVLDPVITVHPDELFFECFSRDESSYGKLGCDYNVFKDINEFECGTTNIDYSANLYNEFQKIRDYKNTSFNIDPSGFVVETAGEEEYKEVKIDLPDSWVRGFLQVSSAMTIPAKTFDLHPMDMHNFCFILRRHKEKQSPRSMRYFLKPGEPVRVLFEPWNYEISCLRSIYKGDEEAEIRIWGRRRLLIMERLIPIAKRFTVSLMGTGLPSFYTADLGDMNFTLGLSGWTANDWSRLGNFDLMAPRFEADPMTQQKVYTALKENWLEHADSLSNRLDLERRTVLGALSSFAQAGRVIFDLNKKVYRIRELSRESLPVESLRFSNDREEAANRLADKNVIKKFRSDIKADNTLMLSGEMRDKSRTNKTEVLIDTDERIAQAECNCNFYKQNKLYKGPCEHMLALRISHARRHQKDWL